MIKILFINAVNPASEIENRYQPLGLMYLAASLQEAFPANTFRIKLVNRDIEKELDSFRPDVAGITAVSQNFNYAARYADYCHDRGIPVMVGGVHISVLPECLTPRMEVGCIGEGEATIVELMKVFIGSGKRFPPKELEKIPGLVFRSGGELVRTPVSPGGPGPAQPPHPCRHLHGKVRHAYIFSSRGCPYRCLFCASSRYWDKPRYFPAGYVVDEIEELAEKWGARLISFYDDLFVADNRRLARIAELVVKRGLAGRVKFTCSCRANTVTPEVVSELKKMGVRSVGLGLESGNSRVLKMLKGRSASVEDNRRAVELLYSAGIRANASFIIGSPDETLAEMMDTYRFIRKSRLSFVDIYLLTPFPGTPVWDLAGARGLVSAGMDWSRLNVNFEENKKNAVIMSEIFSRAEITSSYNKFRRLRLVRNIMALPGHPMIVDLPRVAFGTFREKLSRSTGAIRQGIHHGKIPDPPGRPGDAPGTS
ncbi:MAG: radical SAM protein [Candidatus Glassbacteria bacterium]|nr:radical SAM protein [Candidatus Glassbacteria bacterium]